MDTVVKVCKSQMDNFWFTHITLKNQIKASVFWLREEQMLNPSWWSIRTSAIDSKTAEFLFKLTLLQGHTTVTTTVDRTYSGMGICFATLYSRARRSGRVATLGKGKDSKSTRFKAKKNTPHIFPKPMNNRVGIICKPNCTK